MGREINIALKIDENKINVIFNNIDKDTECNILEYLKHGNGNKNIWNIMKTVELISNVNSKEENRFKRKFKVIKGNKL